MRHLGLRLWRNNPIGPWGFASLCALLFAVVFVLVGCGSSSDDDDLPSPDAVPALVSRWCGGGQDSNGNLGSICIEIDENGNINSLEFNGASAGVGVVQVTEQDDLYSFTMEGDLSGLLALSESGTHLMYLDNNRTVGALDATSSSFPVYSLVNVRGDWSGFSWNVDGGGAPSLGPLATCTVDSDYSYEGLVENDDYYNQSGSTIQLLSTSYGLFFGQHERRDGSSGVLRLILTPDRNALGGYLCEEGDAFPEDCTLVLLER